MGCKDTVSARLEQDWAERIDEYQQARGMENRSDAIEELVKTGYRERQSPLLYRAKQQSKDVAVYLPLVAATVAIIGQGTAALPAQTGYQIAIVLIAMSLTPLAMVVAIQRSKQAIDGGIR